ncbi:MAG: SDR family oxidoreductase, partial [Acidobacteriota bacterium]
TIQEGNVEVSQLRNYLRERLPDYMIPAAFVLMEQLPLTLNGKVDQQALPLPDQVDRKLTNYVAPQTETAQIVAAVWQQVLQLEKVGLYDNFFDLGGHSLLIIQVRNKLQEILGRDIPIIELFRYPTVDALAVYLSNEQNRQPYSRTNEHISSQQELPLHSTREIAIIGMAGRFPGASNLDRFWQNLCNGVESISFFTDEELASAGIDAELLHQSNYVKAAATLEDIDMFDAAFFGINPREAEIMDPQHRIFLETAWEALENAGYDGESYSGSIGVFAGVGINGYLLNNLFPHQELLDIVGGHQALIANDKDHLPTRVSYKLNLKGPSINVQTACSTSLVAVHIACQSLLNEECEIALAGGVSINIPHKVGYLYQEGGITSPDGHCRAFDAQAQGTISGNGVGIVILKRLSKALIDRDNILAIIKGSAVNNDGSLRVGYTAPSVEGQVKVVVEAMARAGIEPSTVTYLETHGTGTVMGDPIEIAALTQAFHFDPKNEKKNFCAIGSVKTNIGHTDTAAGVAGLIKTVLALKHGVIPPSLHFQQSNPNINFADSPFYVNTTLSQWHSNNTPRRAGVSSFGMGGTNVHVVLEEACKVATDKESKSSYLLLLSAKTDSALEKISVNLADYLNHHREVDLSDVAYTLQLGRRAWEHRRMLVCRNVNGAIESLQSLDKRHVFTSFQPSNDQQAIFMFPGQGSQYVNMARELYCWEPEFRKQVDLCAELLKPHLGLDLRDILYPDENSLSAAEQLNQTALTQPALFVIEYALARLWISFGVHPVAMIGHSIGEYVAACLAEVISLEDALFLVAIRGRLIQQLPAGAMLSIALSEDKVESWLTNDLSLAAINGPNMCVVSGPVDAVNELQQRLIEYGVSCKQLTVSHAFHSQMIVPIMHPFAEQVQRITLKPAKIPFISNVTGNWITTAEATDPNYWVKHLRQPVRFSQGLALLLKEPQRILLEVGPGHNLATIAKQQTDSARVIVGCLRHPLDKQSDREFLLNSVGRLWLAGVHIHWPALYINEKCQRLPLPTYPFERQRYWIEPSKQAGSAHHSSSIKKTDTSNWFYLPSWRRTLLPSSATADPRYCWLVFIDDCGMGSQIVKRLQGLAQDVISVMVGERFATIDTQVYTIDPQDENSYQLLLKELQQNGKTPEKIVHLWSITPEFCDQSKKEFKQRCQELGFYSLISLIQAIGRHSITKPIQIEIVTNGVQRVTGQEILCPEKATILGAVKCVPQEYLNISCRCIDITLTEDGHWQEKRLIKQLINEFTSNLETTLVAYRAQDRWLQTFEPLVPSIDTFPKLLKEEGVYLITGGLGKVGLFLAEYLGQTVHAKLILTGRTAFPNKGRWQDWLTVHDEKDSISEQIRRLQALEAIGAEVLVLNADVTDQEQMQSVIEQIYRCFGELNGVIHSAAIPSDEAFRSIQETDRAICEKLFHPKIQGLLVLERVLRGKPIDFFILQSSLSAILGGLGLMAYTAANLFMDAFAHKQNQLTPT